jgi:NAD(P)-dependent dehydrogenase (short-subunit alcohol dehydrogenase family)
MQRPLAVITGASSGIGRELARLAARDGMTSLGSRDVAVMARWRLSFSASAATPETTSRIPR